MNSDETIVFWEEQWRKRASVSRSGQDRPDGKDIRIKRWDQMAKEFAENTSSQNARQRRQAIIAMLENKGALTPDARVLDIGAGPGHWAIAMAATAAHITAIEPSEGMVEILKEQIKARKISNISVDQRTFQEVDLSRENRKGAFDFVFASMTPGINSPEMLYKMMAASKGFCYLSQFSGTGRQKEDDQLWLELFDEPMGRRPGDVIYPFNLLYALGYRPSLEFYFWERKRTWTRQRAIEYYCLMAEERTVVTPGIKDRIEAFVDRHCTDGIMTLRHQACQGIMLWNTAQRIALQ